MYRLKAAIVGLLFPTIVGAIIFLAAGRWDLPFVWGVLIVMGLFYLVLIAFADQGLIRERVSPGDADQDRYTRFIGMPMLLGSWVLVGLDVGRYQWSLIPSSLQMVGLVGYIVSMVAIFWAMHANPFYSSVVRVQSDRGQQAVAVGPYRFVRHPGYAASIFGMLTGGLALGSWLAMVPVLAFAALFVRRTLFEDRLLQRELSGYAEYAQRVRYRLLPGLF